MSNYDIGRPLITLWYEICNSLSSEMKISCHGIGKYCLIRDTDSCIEGTRAIEGSTKWCPARLRILVLPVTMRSIIGLVRSPSGRVDDTWTRYSGCALQVIMTSDIIEAKRLPVSPRLWEEKIS